jgi:hypothetical protein
MGERRRRVQLAKMLFVTSWTDVQCQTEVLEVELWTPSINNLCAFLCRGACFMRVHRSDLQRHVLRSSLNWFLSLLTFRGLSILWHQVKSFMCSKLSMKMPWIGGSKASTSNRSLCHSISNPRISLEAMVEEARIGWCSTVFFSRFPLQMLRSSPVRSSASVFQFLTNLTWIF